MTLQEQLQQAVEEERYEDAASLRDRIAKGEKDPEPKLHPYGGLLCQMTGIYGQLSQRSTSPAFSVQADEDARWRFEFFFEPYREELHQKALKMVQKTHRKLRLKDIAVGLICTMDHRNFTVEYTFGNRTVLKALLHEGGYTLRA